MMCKDAYIETVTNKGNTEMANSTFTMSIEAEEGKAWQHGFHLGTEETLARQIVEETFAARVKHELPIVTIALMRDRKVVDVFDGRWFNSYSAFPFEETAA